jgi:hypothetical protein
MRKINSPRHVQSACCVQRQKIDILHGSKVKCYKVPLREDKRKGLGLTLQPTVSIGLLVEVQLQSVLTFGIRGRRMVSIKPGLLYP